MASIGDEGPLDITHAAERLQFAPRAEVRASLSDVGYESILDVLGTYAGHASVQTNTLPTAKLTSHSLGRSIGR